MKLPSLLLALLLVCASACGAQSEAPAQSVPAEATPAAPVQPAKGEPASDEHDHPHTQPRGRPLPAFSGYTLDDRALDVSDLLGRRLLIVFFNPDAKEALPAVRATRAISSERAKQNFEILGVATGAERASARSFATREDLDFPILDDSSAALARRFGLRTPVALLGTDAEGYMSFGMAGFATDDAAAIETTLRKAMRLPSKQLDTARHPPAPPFRAEVLDGGEAFELAAQRGRAVVLIFFLHTCPHCHAALAFLKQTLEDFPEAQRPRLVGIEVSGQTHAVRAMLKEQGLDFFPVAFDDDLAIQNAYGVFAGVPDIFLIDPEGRIRARSQGWTAEKDEPLLRMRLAAVAGTPVPMLLRTNGYSGSEVCGVCHEPEHETWSFTTHASAFDTLVRHASDSDPECIGCHVVGWQQPGGFTSAQETPALEDVGCESCHGRGGPHLSPDFARGGDYAPVCVTCHDPKHSLGFDYATFRPRISHAENAALVALPAEEKQRILAERGRPGGSLLPTKAAVVGSEACRSCHAAEYEIWAASPHAHAGKTLEAKGKAGEAACLACHTTGFGREGGFPKTGALAQQADLGRVGCESCHGPGGDHVGPDAARRGTILALTDKCDSCVILQICGSCHDDANDPGFEFDVKRKIELQRHGGPAPAASAGRAGETLRGRSDAELLAHAFAPPEQRNPRWTGR